MKDIKNDKSYCFDCLFFYLREYIKVKNVEINIDMKYKI